MAISPAERLSRSSRNQSPAASKLSGVSRLMAKLGASVGRAAADVGNSVGAAVGSGVAVSSGAAASVGSTVGDSVVAVGATVGGVVGGGALAALVAAVVAVSDWSAAATTAFVTTGAVLVVAGRSSSPRPRRAKNVSRATSTSPATA